jgi:hypothetical protein
VTRSNGPSLPPVMPDYDETRDEIEEAIFRLVRKGQVVDSGRRRWSERTGRYQIVWVAKCWLQ